MKKTAAEAVATRRAILASALTIFSQHGYNATTLEQIARAADVTRGAVYWHFANKADLYGALLQTYGGQAASIMQAAATEGGSFREVCQRILSHLLAHLEDDPEFRAMIELSLFKTEHTEELASVWESQLAGTRDLVAQLTLIMQEGITQGALRTDSTAADLARGFLAYQQGLFHLWLIDPKAFSLRERAPVLANLFIRGICA